MTPDQGYRGVFGTGLDACRKDGADERKRVAARSMYAIDEVMVFVRVEVLNRVIARDVYVSAYGINSRLERPVERAVVPPDIREFRIAPQ